MLVSGIFGVDIDCVGCSGCVGCVDVSIVRKLKNQITLSEIKSKKELKQFPLVRIGRLSVVPVSENEWSIILAMEEK